MKKRTLILLAVVLLGGLTFTSCDSSTTEKDGNQTNAAETTETYYCPMECEGDKTYAEAGSCPVCGMDLVIKE